MLHISSSGSHFVFSKAEFTLGKIMHFLLLVQNISLTNFRFEVLTAVKITIFVVWVV
jgi:hypothetical protein